MYRGDIVENGTTYFHYSLDFQPGNHISGNSILYDYTNKIWKDGDDTSPFYLHSSVPLVGTSFTITNPAHLHGFDTNSTEYFGFPNPYYEAPVPNTLLNIGTGAYLWSSTLTYHSQTATHYLYTVDNDLQYSIKVGKSGETDYNEWSDNGSSTPSTVIDGTTVYLKNGGQVKYAFTKPTTASWL